MLAVFALTIGVRVMADVAPYGYGIYYDMPLFLIFIIVVARCTRTVAPALTIDRQRMLVNFMLAAELIMFAVARFPGVNQRSMRLETSWGEIYLAPAESVVVDQIIGFMSEQKRKGRRVVLLPEDPCSMPSLELMRLAGGTFFCLGLSPRRTKTTTSQI